jgi:hypothetical protein
MSHKTYQRNNKCPQPSEEHGKIIDAEVKNLFKDQYSDCMILAKLRAKYSDDELVEAIFDEYKNKQEKIDKNARKLAKHVIQKYGQYGNNLSKYLCKAQKYKKKYNFSDAEFAEFQRVLEQTLMGRGPARAGTMEIRSTRIGKTLGYSHRGAFLDKLKLQPNEYSVLQDILNIGSQTKAIHAQAILQSMVYQDCDVRALTGIFKPDKHNNMSYVHPVVAAMFIPKIQIFEEHLLYASIANIIRLKHEQTPIKTKPEYELLWDMVVDPNDIACNVDSPLMDLKNRVHMQWKLWESVIRLRSGQYYNDPLNQFLTTIDNCRINMYDSPDLMYVKDEGAILRRLLSAFSFRPTVISTSPVVAPFSSSLMTGDPVMTKVTSIPMITLRLPLDLQGRNTSIHLNSALDQYHWFFENNTIVPKATSIIFSKGVIIFYVNRRFQTINLGRLMTPHQFTSLPLTISSFEKLNDSIVNYDNVINIADDEYQLRSVVFVERTKVGDESVITGATTGIRRHIDSAAQVYHETCLHYDPLKAGMTFVRPGVGPMFDAPITVIPPEAPLGGANGVDSFCERARRCGTIFIYQKTTNKGSRYFTGL